MIEQLSSRIWSHAAFHEDAARLQSELLKSRYITTDIKYDEKSLMRLLRSAVVLAASKDREHRQTAYEIATAASELNAEKYPGVPFVLLLVLGRLANFPALTYAKRRFSIDEASLPTREVAEASSRSANNSIEISGKKFALTDFQFQLWSELNRSESVGISAPTSAGKSFILQTYARKRLADGNVDNIAFLVPTRALINQVSEEVSDWLRVSGMQVELVTTPIPKDTDLPSRAIYVLTQERLQLIQAAHPFLSLDLMLVDEAQSIADGARGVLLSSVIEESLVRNSKMQLLFAGPNIREPGNIATHFGRKAHSVGTQEATVTQNIIFVDCDAARPKSASLALRSKGQKVPLGSVECDQPLTDHKSKLVNLALRLGAGGQNLIYALGPAECEGIAFGLADNDVPPDNPELQELSDFIKEAVHPKYQLAKNVLQGVGFHYGRLPALVRKAIEDAFKDGQLQYLVTTSTLLYGVNLPAQNLFLHKPEKGKRQPISSLDFWNLAGRAGRLGREFTGNIFLIDYGEWKTDPLVGERDQVVKPSIEDHVADRVEELIAYIKDPGKVPSRQKPDELENTFVKLVRDQLNGKLETTLDHVGLAAEDPRRSQLVQVIGDVIENTDIAPATLVASPTVSLHRQQSLYERLEKSLKTSGAASIIPKHPMDNSSYDSYSDIIKCCHEEILKYRPTDRSHKYFALVALKWIKGESLPKIIDASFQYQEGQGRNPNIAKVIRDILNEIEQELRFKYVRLFSCYNAVLEQVLTDNNRADLVGSIPSIPMYLEVGACSPTMISFMGLGLSRYTAGKLNAIPRRMEMSQNDARLWILRQDVEALNLPSASVKEIRRMVFSS